MRDKTRDGWGGGTLDLDHAWGLCICEIIPLHGQIKKIMFFQLIRVAALDIKITGPPHKCKKYNINKNSIKIKII